MKATRRGLQAAYAMKRFATQNKHAIRQPCSLVAHGRHAHRHVVRSNVLADMRGQNGRRHCCRRDGQRCQLNFTRRAAADELLTDPRSGAAIWTHTVHVANIRALGIRTLHGGTKRWSGRPSTAHQTFLVANTAVPANTYRMNAHSFTTLGTKSHTTATQVMLMRKTAI